MLNKRKIILMLMVFSILMSSFCILRSDSVSALERDTKSCRHVYTGSYYYNSVEENIYKHNVLVASYPNHPQDNEYEECTIIVEREYYREKCIYCGKFGDYTVNIYEVRDHSCVFCNNERIKIQ